MTPAQESSPMASAVRALVSVIAQRLPPAARVELAAQLRHLVRVVGKPTMLDIVLSADAPRMTLDDGPLDPKPSVVDDLGKPIGELLVWISSGVLSGLEFAWWTDEPPAVLPSVTQLRWPAE